MFNREWQLATYILSMIFDLKTLFWIYHDKYRMLENLKNNNNTSPPLRLLPKQHKKCRSAADDHNIMQKFWTTT